MISALFNVEINNETDKLIYNGKLNKLVEIPGTIHKIMSEFMQNVTSKKENIRS